MIRWQLSLSSAVSLPSWLWGTLPLQLPPLYSYRRGEGFLPSHCSQLCFQIPLSARLLVYRRARLPRNLEPFLPTGLVEVNLTDTIICLPKKFASSLLIIGSTGWALDIMTFYFRWGGTVSIVVSQGFHLNISQQLLGLLGACCSILKFPSEWVFWIISSLPPGTSPSLDPTYLYIYL